MKKLLVASHLIKYLGEGNERTIVLSDVSLDIHEGEFVAIMGPSGSGKSTLMYALSGMDDVNEGKVTFQDKDLSAYSEDERSDLRRQQMGFVFQQPTLLKNLNVLDNIILPSTLGNKKQAVNLTERAKSLMEQTGIGSLAKRAVTEVSGGQLQRVGICRALIGSPKIIFGDEPTGALNSKSANEIMDIFSTIHAQGTAIVLVTHDIKVAAYAQRVLFMSDGCVVEELSLFQLQDNSLEHRMNLITAKMRQLEI
ncbi:Macrolide export ATP-binding/permease protein MacB [compost metagenome]